MRSICSGLGAGAKLKTIGLNSAAWLDFHELRCGDPAVLDSKHAGIDLRADIFRKLRDAARRAAFVELAAELRHAVGDGDNGADRRGLFRPAQKFDVGYAEPRQHRLDVMVVGVEIENAFGLRVAFLLDDGLEQIFLVLEIDIERALGDAGRAGNVVHARGIEALGQKHGARAVDDLTPLGAFIVRRGGRHPFEYGLFTHRQPLAAPELALKGRWGAHFPHRSVRDIY